MILDIIFYCYLRILSLCFNTLRWKIPPVEECAVQLTRMISVVDVDGGVLGRDADQVVAEFAQDVAHSEYAQNPGVVEKAELLFKLIEHDEAERINIG